MIRINLLPREIYADRARAHLKNIAVAVGVAVVVLLVGVWGLLLQQKTRLAARLADAQNELRKYEAIAAEVNQLEQTRNQLQARRDVIKNLMGLRLVYPKFFEDFMALLPPEIWIGNLTTTSDPQGAGVTVNTSATSTSSYAIADWLVRLQNSPLCRDVQLASGITAQEQGEDKPVLYGFSMTFHCERKEQ